jgi:ferrous iron transport protein A
MQVSSNNAATLLDLQLGQSGVVDSLDLPDSISRRLMELGFLPGESVRAGRSAPGGDPRVFEVDGGQVALRRDTAARIRLR